MTTRREAQTRSKTLRMSVPASIDVVNGVAHAAAIEILDSGPNPPTQLPCSAREVGEQAGGLSFYAKTSNTNMGVVDGRAL